MYDFTLAGSHVLGQVYDVGFFMNTRPSQRRLVPQVLAGFLFFGGSWFAILLLPLVVGLLFDSDGWRLLVFFILGYLVYFGWFWRAWRTPSIFFATSLWLISLAQNSLPWLFLLHEERWHLPAMHGFQTHGSIPGFGFITFGWWMIASFLSAVALIFELLPRRHDGWQ
jgi:hypothetical protein